MPVDPYLRDRYLAAVKGQMQNSVTIDMQSMIAGAVAAHEGAVGGILGFIGQTFGALQTRERGRFKEAHRDVGSAAVRSMAQGFNSRRFRRPAGRYRQDQDRLSGRLGKALGAVEPNVRASEYALEIVNQDYLDREAAHWRRLNFGAGGGSVEGIIAPQEFPILWAGVAVGTLGLEPQPSPAFRIPKGYWITPDGERMGASASRVGMDQFFLPGMIAGRGIRGRPSPTRMTRGIASRNFIDAGVRRVANELPRAYIAIYEDMFERSRADLDALAASYGTIVVTPQPQALRYFYRRSNRVPIGR